MSSGGTPGPGNNENTNIEIQSDPEVLKGVFTNVTNIGHSKEEFIIDYLFIQQQPIPFGKLVSRAILTPSHAKRLLHALQDNVHKYEKNFGTIDNGELANQGKRTLQ